MTEKEKLLSAAFDTILELGLGINNDLSILDELAVDDVMGYGTTVDEKLFSLSALKKLLVTQAKLIEGVKVLWERKPVLRRISANGYSAVFADDITGTMVVENETIQMYLRFSCILEYIDNKWMLVHWHASKPENVQSEVDSFGIEKWKERNSELEKLVIEKTADLVIKNRELEIEGALEKIRSRTMAMQHSSELQNAAILLFQQVQSLGIKTGSCGFFIWMEDEKTAMVWNSSQEGNLQMPFKLPHTQIPHYKRVYEAAKKGDEFHVEEVSGEALEKQFNYLRTLDGIKEVIKKYEDAGIALPSLIIYHDVFFKQGYLSFHTHEPREDAHDIFKRFGKVFEQTYSRFLDLQKAEAQAREAEIELALERVRARTMAMQHSNELIETSELLFEQMKNLGIGLWSCGFSLWYDDDSYFLGYNPGPDGKMGVPLKIPLKEDVFFTTIREAKRRGDNFLVFESGGESLVQTYRYMDTLPVVGETMRGFVEAGFPLPTYQVTHCGFFSHGHLMFITQEPNPAAIDIFKRFTKVFDQTYTRFLDLQKAEAQAREAQIEASLERVRASAMSMHHSDELSKVLSILFDQFDILGINPVDAHLDLFDWEKNIFIYRATGKRGARVIAEQIVDLDSRPEWQALAEKWKASKPNSIDLSFYPKEVIRALMDFFPDIWAAMPAEAIMDPEEFPDGMFDTLGYHKFGYLGFHHYRPATDEEKNVLIRFANEFERLYQRFLDLQKAEAQAREAQIEAALERVRSRTMAMQKSDELTDVAGLLFAQVSALGVKTWTAGFNVWSEDNNSYVDYITSPNGGFIEPYIVYTETAEALRDISNARKSGVEFDVQYVEGEKIKQLYLALQKLDEKQYEIMLQDEVRFPAHQYEHFVFGSKVSLMFITYEPVPEAHDLFKRLGKVFEQTYTRFLDLQKAEAQAREAKIETALEKVRSRTMAMQHSDELPLAANLLFLEVQALGIPSWSAGYNILADDKKSSTCIMSSEGQIQSAFHLPFSNSGEPSFAEWLDAIETKQSFIVQELSGKAIDDHYNYMKSLPQVGHVLKELEDAGISLPTYQINHLSFFNDGFLLFITYEPVPHAHDIFKRFTKVFEQTYTRFLDLQKAEAQAREAQIEAALERVRSRTMAMQSSEELADAAYVLFEQLNILGVTHERINIGIVNEATQTIDFWVTEQGGEKLNTKFSGRISEPTTLAKAYRAYKNGEKSITIDLNGEGLKQWLQFMAEEIRIPFNNAFLHDRRVQTAGFFSKGMLVVTSPEPLATEALYLLEKFAGVFDLTYTRFSDLKIAEAHALQAEEDLIKLQTEKQRAEDALTELKATQTQLIQSEKMASLGELTAGIAHEIQNPLNFVNNFSEVSKELLDEMKTALDNGDSNDAKEIANDVIQNLEKINHHGKRADAIVKGMLQHSRTSTGIKEPTDINALCDEYLRLSYHGLRAKDKSFNASLKTDFDKSIGNINIIPQDIGRVVLNLLTNAFYAVGERSKAESLDQGIGIVDEKKKTPLPPEGGVYDPTVSISTKKLGDKVLISVNDNGNGIPQKILDKIFQPFFTTKPTGQGTGLGLSLSYDIVKAQGGEIKVETKQGEGTTFLITLPQS